MRSPDLEIQELDLSKEVAQKWTGFTPFLSSPPFLCYGVYFDFSQQLFTKSEVFCKYSTQTGFHKILKKYKVPVCRDSYHNVDLHFLKMWYSWHTIDLSLKSARTAFVILGDWSRPREPKSSRRALACYRWC